MSKFFDKVSVFITLLANGIKRFYANTFFTALIFGLAFYLINWEGIGADLEKTLGRIILVSILGFLITTLFTLISEKLNRNTKLIKIINVATSLVIPVLYFFFVLTDIENKYQATTLVGIFIAMILVAVYYSNKTDNEEFTIHFSYLIRNLFFSAVITLIVMLGLFLCTAAVYFLIYKFSELHKIYATIAAFSWIMLFTNLFLSMLPKGKEDIKIPKFFKITTLYTALPIYVGLILILYIYLGKIVVTQKFPSGQLNWFASFASLIGIFLFLTLKQYKSANTFVKWYVKLFGYVIIPIISMQCIAYGIRYSSYGFTAPRYISAVLIGISIVTAIVSLIKNGKHVPYILFLLAFCSIITTTGAFNLHDVPIFEQEGRLAKVLKEASMLSESNKIIAKTDVNNDTKIKITSSYDYIANNDDAKKSKLLKDYDIKNESFKQIFGFDREYEKAEDIDFKSNNGYVNYNSQQQEVNISGFNKLINISYYHKNVVSKQITNNTLTIQLDEKKYVFDLNDLVKALYDEYGQTDIIPHEKLMVEQDNRRLVISNISFEVNKNNNNEISINNVDGYILEK